MTFIIIIFFASITTAFGMLFFRSWEIRTSKIKPANKDSKVFPEIPFRHLEKNMLYLVKHLIQGFIFIIAKYWFISTTKIKQVFNDKWPKINDYFKKKPREKSSYRHSFLRKAIIESKAKIKHIKEKIKEESNSEEDNTPN